MDNNENTTPPQESESNIFFLTSGLSEMGPNKTVNEDSLLLLSEYCIWGVVNGVGGPVVEKSE